MHKYYQAAVHLKQGVDRLLSLATSDYKCPKVLQGRLLARLNESQKGISSLHEVEFQVFSQFGDDGIIQWLTSRLPHIKRTFVEFGVEDYKESNTRFLLVNNYWSGLVIDGSETNVDSIRRDQISFFYDLQSICAFITKDNIEGLVEEAGFGPEIGLLSVDIDGNDYWVWKAIATIRPAILICEYNCLFGPSSPYTIIYDANFVRGRQYPFSYYGTSLSSACDLASERNMSFIGCNSAGNNAYFVRNDLLPSLEVSCLAVVDGYRFSSFSEARSDTGAVLRGAEKVRVLDKLPVFNTRTNSMETFEAEMVIQELVAASKLPRTTNGA